MNYESEKTQHFSYGNVQVVSIYIGSSNTLYEKICRLFFVALSLDRVSGTVLAKIIPEINTWKFLKFEMHGSLSMKGVKTEAYSEGGGTGGNCPPPKPKSCIRPWVKTRKENVVIILFAYNITMIAFFIFILCLFPYRKNHLSK